MPNRRTRNAQKSKREGKPSSSKGRKIDPEWLVGHINQLKQQLEQLQEDHGPDRRKWYAAGKGTIFSRGRADIRFELTSMPFTLVSPDGTEDGCHVHVYDDDTNELIDIVPCIKRSDIGLTLIDISADRRELVRWDSSPASCVLQALEQRRTKYLIFIWTFIHNRNRQQVEKYTKKFKRLSHEYLEFLVENSQKDGGMEMVLQGGGYKNECLVGENFLLRMSRTLKKELDNIEEFIALTQVRRNEDYKPA